MSDQNRRNTSYVACLFLFCSTVFVLDNVHTVNGFLTTPSSFSQRRQQQQQQQHHFLRWHHQSFDSQRLFMTTTDKNNKNIDNDNDLQSTTVASSTTTTTQDQEMTPTAVATTTHSTEQSNEEEENVDNGIVQTVSKSLSTKVNTWKQVSKEGFGTKAKNVASTMVPGDIVVPLCANLEQRQELANRGIYAGVEYLVCDIILQEEENEHERVAMIKPRYPLRDHLERNDWPVMTKPCIDAPIWISRATWEAGTALGTLGLTGGYLVLAAILAFVFRFVYVPSESMIPNLNPGDIVLVSRSVPVLQKAKVGDVVLFDPPSKLNQIIRDVKERQEKEQQQNDGDVDASDRNSIQSLSSGSQLLKRVVAVPNEMVGVKNSNPYVETGRIVTKDKTEKDPQQQQQSTSLSSPSSSVVSDSSTNNQEALVPKRIVRADIVGPYARSDILNDDTYWNRSPQPLGKYEYFVAGDNGYRSVDSRVWGPLEQKYIFGTAKWILYPPKHFGPVPSSENMVTIELPLVASPSTEIDTN